MTLLSPLFGGDSADADVFDLAVALAIGAGGALSEVKTTVLLTVDETLQALRKAGQVKYRPPGTQ